MNRTLTLTIAPRAPEAAVKLSTLSRFAFRLRRLAADLNRYVDASHKVASKPGPSQREASWEGPL